MPCTSVICICQLKWGVCKGIQLNFSQGDYNEIHNEHSLKWFLKFHELVVVVPVLPQDSRPVFSYLWQEGSVPEESGRTSPKKIENPSTKRFREEFKSMNCKLESPTAVIIPREKTSDHKIHYLTYAWMTSTGQGPGQTSTMAFLCPIRNKLGRL